GVIVLFIGAMGVFGELQDSLNNIWKVQPKPGRAVWTVIRERLLSFVMVLGVAFLLLVSLVISAALTALGNYLWDAQTASLGQLLNQVLSFAALTVVIAMIYRFVPDAETAWKDVWLGAVVTSLLFNLGKYLIGLYLGQASIGSAYGAAGSLAVFLI